MEIVIKKDEDHIDDCLICVFTKICSKYGTLYCNKDLGNEFEHLKYHFEFKQN